jgi:hypothetical protein
LWLEAHPGKIAKPYLKNKLKKQQKDQGCGLSEKALNRGPEFNLCSATGEKKSTVLKDTSFCVRGNKKNTPAYLYKRKHRKDKPGNKKI